MADYTIGSSGGDFEDTMRRAQQAAQAQDELNRKESQRRASEEETAGTEAGSARVRTDLAAATQDLSSALTANTSVLGLETAALRANTEWLERNLAARRGVASVRIPAGGEVAYGAPAAAGSGGGGGRRPPPVVAAGGFEEDPNAGARLAAAQRTLAEAELARAAAQAQVVTTRRQPGTTPETLVPLIEQREVASQQVATARADLRAAQASVAAQEQIAQQKAAQLAEAQQVNAALAAERAAIARTTAEQAAAAAAAAETAVSGRAPLALGAGAARVALGAGPPVAGGPADAIRQQVPRTFSVGPPFSTTRGGPTDPVRPPTEELDAYRQTATANSAYLTDLTAKQREANQAFAEAGAVYADTSTRLSRHGALTTEFIQALAQGQVTLREFESQMLSTIGKFGGWAIAGAAVYGVYGALKDLLHGATETQAAVQQLGRFIPGLGGPAGGGNAQIGQAEGLVRDISTQFNVPISEVTDSMQVVARVFHNLGDAGQATRAVLAATRLDQVPQQQATQYLVGISQSLGLNRGGQLVDVVNSLNALQAGIGARVSQTLPALARAAPAANAAGLDLPTLEAVTALGVRAGIPGAQVGTALLRSVGTFSNRESAQLTFRAFGITPEQGQAGNLFRDVFRVIDTRTRQGTLSGVDVSALARALGGNLLGARTILPILEQEAVAAQQGRQSPFESALTLAKSPRSYQEDLNAVLGTVSERFRAIGIALQNFGSRLYEVGALTPITALLDTFTVAAHLLEQVTSPITDALAVFNQLPAAARDVLGVFVAFRAARYLLSTGLGGAAQSYIGRLPGQEALLNLPRESVEGAQGRLNTYLIPRANANLEAASARNLDAQENLRSTREDLAGFQAANAGAAVLPETDPAKQQYEAGVAERIKANQAAAEKSVAAENALGQAARQAADLEAQLVILKDENLKFAVRASFLEQQGMVASTEIVNLKDQLVTAYREQLAGAAGGAAAIRSGGGSVAGGAETALAAGGVAAITAASARSLIGNRTLIGDLNKAVADEAQPPANEPLPVGPYRPIAEPGRGAVPEVAPPSGGIVGAQLAGAAAFASVQARAEAATKNLLGLAGGPGLPIAGLLGTQLLGGAIGGGVGSYITNVGGTAASGALIAQLLGRSVAGGAAIGTVLGSLQQPGSGAGIGAGVGAVLGGIAGFGVGDAATIPIGAAIGSVVGSVAGTIFGGGGGGGKSQTDIVNEANRRAAQLLGAATPGEQLNAFQSEVSDNIVEAVSGSGSSSTNAQANLKSITDRLTAQLTLFGTEGAFGRGVGRQQIGALINAAVGTATTNPAAAAQIIGQATQPYTAAIQGQFNYSLAQSTTPAQATRASSAAQAALQQQQSGSYDSAITQAREALQVAQASLEHALMGGSLKAIDEAEKIYSGARDNLTGVQNAARVAGQANTLARQALAAQAFQQADQLLQSQGALSQARAGGGQEAQLEAAHATLQQRLRLAQTAPGLSAQTKQQAINADLAALSQNYTQQVQQQYGLVQAQGQLSVAQVAPGDTVGQARANVAALQGQLAFVQAHARAFDPSQIVSLEAQIQGARNQLVQTIASQAQQLAQLAGQLASARDVGNTTAQAQDLLTAARNSATHAIGPVAQRQAALEIVTQQNALHDANLSRTEAQAQLTAAEHPGDSVAQAEAAVRGAQQELAMARGIDERIKAETDLANAENQLNQARTQRYVELGALAASTTSDPLQQLRDQIQGAAQALQHTVGTDARIQAQTQLNSLKLQYQSTLISQRESTIQFQLDMQQITVQQAINQYESLLKVRDITKADRQRILEDVRKLQAGDFTPIGGSATGFDLAPGNLRLPTFYDVAGALHRGRLSTGISGNNTTHVDARNEINVYVRNANDVHKVADVLDRATGSHLEQRLRAAGLK